MAKIEDFDSDFRTFIEGGFIAVTQGDEDAATKCFDAARAIRPDHSAWKVGVGYIALNKLQLKESAAIFEEIWKSEPDHTLARTLLGVSLLLAKETKKEGEKHIKEATEKAEDPTIQNLGKVAMDWAKDNMKEEKAPFFSE